MQANINNVHHHKLKFFQMIRYLSLQFVPVTDYFENIKNIVIYIDIVLLIFNSFFLLIIILNLYKLFILFIKI